MIKNKSRKRIIILTLTGVILLGGVVATTTLLVTMIGGSIAALDFEDEQETEQQLNIAIASHVNEQSVAMTVAGDGEYAPQNEYQEALINVSKKTGIPMWVIHGYVVQETNCAPLTYKPSQMLQQDKSSDGCSAIGCRGPWQYSIGFIQPAMSDAFLKKYNIKFPDDFDYNHCFKSNPGITAFPATTAKFTWYSWGTVNVVKNGYFWGMPEQLNLTDSPHWCFPKYSSDSMLLWAWSLKASWETVLGNRTCAWLKSLGFSSDDYNNEMVAEAMIGVQNGVGGIDSEDLPQALKPLYEYYKKNKTIFCVDMSNDAACKAGGKSIEAPDLFTKLKGMFGVSCPTTIRNQYHFNVPQYGMSYVKTIPKSCGGATAPGASTDVSKLSNDAKTILTGDNWKTIALTRLNSNKNVRNDLNNYAIKPEPTVYSLKVIPTIQLGNTLGDSMVKLNISRAGTLYTQNGEYRPGYKLFGGQQYFDCSALVHWCARQMGHQASNDNTTAWPGTTNSMLAYLPSNAKIIAKQSELMAGDIGVSHDHTAICVKPLTGGQVMTTETNYWNKLAGIRERGFSAFYPGGADVTWFRPNWYSGGK